MCVRLSDYTLAIFVFYCLEYSKNINKGYGCNLKLSYFDLGQQNAYSEIMYVIIYIVYYSENVAIICIFCQVRSLVGSYFEKYWSI